MRLGFNRICLMLALFAVSTGGSCLPLPRTFGFFDHVGGSKPVPTRSPNGTAGEAGSIASKRRWTVTIGGPPVPFASFVGKNIN
jgi:hypothetical protein